MDSSLYPLFSVRQNAATETEKIPGREISRVTSLNGSNDATLYGEDRQTGVVGDLANPMDDKKYLQSAKLSAIPKMSYAADLYSSASASKSMQRELPA